MKKLNILFFLLIPFIKQAQYIEWVQQYHNLYKTNAQTVATDKNKNVYVAGSYSGDDHAHSPYVQGMFLRKYNPAGILKWSKTYDNIEIADIAIDTIGKVFITGYIHPGAHFGNFASINQTGSFYASINADGNETFFQSLKNTKSGMTTITFDKNNNYYLCGPFNDTLTFSCNTLLNPASPGNYGLFIIKYNSDNQCLWAKQTHGGCVVRSYYNKFVFDNEDNFYVSGQNFGSVSFDPNHTIVAQGADNTFIAKYDINGNVLWIKNIGTATNGGQEEITSITCDKYGNVWATGSYDSDLIIDGSYLSSNNTYFPKPFLIKLDKSGVCISATQDNYSYAIINGAYYKYGGVNAPGIYNNVNLQSGFYIMRCDTNWNGLYAFQPPVYGGFTVDEDDNLYLTGGFSGTADFGKGNILTGNMDMFIAKYSPPLALGIKKQISDLNEINIYPNPTANIFTISFSSAQTVSQLQINVIDALGKTVYTETTTAFTGSLKKEINLSGLSKGTYVIKLSSQDFIETKKIVVE